MDGNTAPQRPRVIIVGAGFGGLEAARVLGSAPVDLTVIDRTNHFLFQPLLYQVATAALSPADISAPIRSVLRRQRNTRVLMAEVTGLDLENRRVLMGDRAEPYDVLVLATGAGSSYFGHDDWAHFAPGLKTTTDATEIRGMLLSAFEAAEMEADPRRRAALMTFVVVGGGPTGVEMAGAIAELAHNALAKDFRRINPASARIILVEAGERLLTPFPAHLANKAHVELQRLGVHIRTHSAVEHIDGDGVTIAGEHLETCNVIWAAGVRPSPAGQWLRAKTDHVGRVVVSPDLTVPGHPEIFVIGDTASATQDGKPLPGVAPVAMQQGRYVGRVIRARAGRSPLPPEFHYLDKGYLATVGRAHAIGYVGKLQFSGFIAWLVWAFVHILYLIVFRNRVLVMVQWAWLYLTWQRGARLIPQPQDPARAPGEKLHSVR